MDPYGQVAEAWDWDYDQAGNRTFQVHNGELTYYHYNAGNQLTHEITGADTTYYQYDHRGNQTVKLAPTGNTYFQYNHQNLMTRIDFPDGSSSQFGYDGDGKRVWVNDNQGARRMIYQGPDMLKLFQEKDVVGQTVAQYTMGLGLESMRRGEASSFYHYDALGSTQELTDEAEAVTDAYRYNAWGEVLARMGSTDNPHAYVGRLRYYAVLEAGLLQLGVRYLELVSGRFLQRDPAEQRIDPYRYGGNRPGTMTDPSGQQLGWPSPYCLAMMYHLRHAAYEQANQYAEGGWKPGTPANALVHCIWMCLGTRWAGGPDCAWEVGNIHELQNRCGGQPAEEETRDRHNNNVGIKIGLMFWKGCDVGCKEALDRGDLR